MLAALWAVRRSGVASGIGWLNAESSATPVVEPVETSDAAVLKILDVAFWGITGSSVTISWTTDVPATTAVSYGTTSDLGQNTPVQKAMTHRHGVTLTGLQGGTTYHFVARSVDGAGNPGVSKAYSFTTVVTAPPDISGIVVVPAAGNKAQISWVTSVPANSYVEFGSTTAYGSWSSRTDLTTHPKPNLGWVGKGLIHYRLVSTDSIGNKAVSRDFTFMEP